MRIQFHKTDSSGTTFANFHCLLFGLLLLASTVLFSGCRNSTQVNQNGAQPSPSPTPGSAFDGQRAFEHVRKQVEFGPRPAGSSELAKTREYIVGQLHSFGLNVTTDEFSPETPIGVRKMVNVTAELPGESGDVIIISSHYDTKLYKDFTFVGANDAGSSTGAVLELARILSAGGKKPRFTYWFVFFDGEEAFCEGWDECKVKGEPDNTYGSRRFVAQLIEKKEKERVRAMILLDMVGYKELEFGRELDLSTKWLIDVVWGTAQDLGHGQKFVQRNEGCGADDHEPFLKAGIESVDIIQLSTYDNYWHTAGDTLDKISPESLKIVGDVVAVSLPRIEQRLTGKSG